MDCDFNPGVNIEELDSKEMHQSLVKIIRNVHEDLRRNYQKCGDFESVWTEHLGDDHRLKEYSAAMHKLATTVWTRNNPTTRIDWCHRICTEYFATVEPETWRRTFPVAIPDGERLRLLDVGSCYGPFSRWHRYRTINVDIAPATENVLQCDFLKVDVVEEEEEDMDTVVSRLTSPVLRLPSSCFHAVVFSLVLEYLPCRGQRRLFCVRANQVLVDRGLLLVVTPDSKHPGYNRRMIDSWKRQLEDIGFARHRYDKQTHLHCMAFVKVNRAKDRSVGPGLFIPQDFRDYEALSVPVRVREQRTQCQDRDLSESFRELPYDDNSNAG